MKLLCICSAFAVIFGCMACTKSDQPVSDDLHLRHKGADMPIWVRGNPDSQKIVLYVHGGPGDCAMCYRYYLQKLEQDFMVAYWDQRIAGASSGTAQPETLTYEQFGEDMELVINLLRQEYPNAQIYLLAHSFGVELVWQYLSDPANQQNIAGLALVNGTFSTYRWLYHQREWVRHEAALQGNQPALDWVNAHPVTPESVKTLDWQRQYRWMLDLGGNPVSVTSDKKYVLNYLFATPNTALAQFGHGSAYGSEYANNEIRKFDQTAVLSSVNIPVMMLWGRKDGVVPAGVAEETRDLLVNCQQKEIIWFDNAWHEPFISENEKFLRELTSFLKRY